MTVPTKMPILRLYFLVSLTSRKIWRTKAPDNTANMWVVLQVHFGLKTVDDLVYQTVNIMYECRDATSDGYEIHALKNAGVNIFNVDLTKHSLEFLEKIEAAIDTSHNMPEMIPAAYYIPVSLSVTMSVNDPIKISERVDIIILKDLKTYVQLHEFKQLSEEYSSKPIMFWPSSLELEDFHELIKFSGGLILEWSLFENIFEFKYVLQQTKALRKPVFFMSTAIVEDYYEETANDRQLLQQVYDIVENRLDGMFLVDKRKDPPIEMIQALIKATEIIERDYHHPLLDYFKTSVPLPLPVLQPYTVALSASLAAVKSEASAILVFTKTGGTARVLSFASPPCRVIAITRHAKATRQMHLYRKIMPLHYREQRKISWQKERAARVAFGTQFGLETGLFNYDAKLVVLSPYCEEDLYCNCIQVAFVPDIVHAFKCGADVITV